MSRGSTGLLVLMLGPEQPTLLLSAHYHLAVRWNPLLGVGVLTSLSLTAAYMVSTESYCAPAKTTSTDYLN